MTTANLLIIEDDTAFAHTLMRRLTAQQFNCVHSECADNALLLARQHLPRYVLLDMKLANQSGLQLLHPLRQVLPHARIILLTGYASIATAVEAMRQGADDYLAKPASLALIVSALKGEHSAKTGIDEQTVMSPERLEWEHIQQVLAHNQGNISQTARQLNMHRRTLQRKLQKKPVSQ